jgi:hypothetical protein
LITLPSSHGIELGFFDGCRITGLTLERLDFERCTPEIFLEMTYHRPRSSDYFGETSNV